MNSSFCALNWPVRRSARRGRTNLDTEVNTHVSVCSGHYYWEIINREHALDIHTHHLASRLTGLAVASSVIVNGPATEEGLSFHKTATEIILRGTFTRPNSHHQGRKGQKV